MRTKKADWRLVAAAQAMRRGEYANEFEAAAAMGKQISQCREVEHWSEKLMQLEQQAAAARDGSAANTAGLLVEAAWISKNIPGIQQVHASELVLSPAKQHGKRTISAVSSTPGGSSCEVSACVKYTPQPADRESENASKRRGDRHRRREERALRSLDLSGSTQQHSTAESARRQAARATAASEMGPPPLLLRLAPTRSPTAPSAWDARPRKFWKSPCPRGTATLASPPLLPSDPSQVVCPLLPKPLHPSPNAILWTLTSASSIGAVVSETPRPIRSTIR